MKRANHPTLVLKALMLSVCLTGVLRSDQPSPVKLNWSVRRTENGDFVLRARASRAVRIPRIHDFRLERVDSDGPHQLPMLFGNEDSLAWPAGATCNAFQITLDGVPDDSEERLQAQRKSDNDSVRLFARTMLQQDSHYRLTWRDDSVKPATEHVAQFRTQRKPDSQQQAKSEKRPKRFYLCEILFRHEGVLFLGQTIAPALNPYDHTIAAVGFSESGSYYQPPDPGYQNVQSIARDVRHSGPEQPRIKPPLAGRTHYYGADADEHGVTIRVSDQAFGFQWPEGLDDVTYAMGVDVNPWYPASAAIFRFERLAGNRDCLRQDLAYWKQRTTLITKEVLARKDWLREAPERRLPIATFVLQDKDLLTQTRAALSDWLKLDPDAAKESWRQAHAHANVLLCRGDPVDVPVLTMLTVHEVSGGYLMYFAETIGNRFGIARAGDLLAAMLKRRDVSSDRNSLTLLRTVENSLPVRLRCDEALIDCARLLDRSPADFGFVMAEARLLELSDSVKLTDDQQYRFLRASRNESGCWYAPSVAVRKRAVARMSKLLTDLSP